MKKIILICLLLVSLSLYAQEDEDYGTPVMTTQSGDDERHFNHRKSHLLTTLGVERLGYEVPWDFQGERKSFSNKTQELYGGRLGFGWEIYLGAGFMTTTRVEGFYMGTLFTSALTADPDVEDIEFAYTKNTGSIYGADISQSLGFLFNLKTKNPIMDEMTYLTVEPFIEAGIGRANAYNRLAYNYDTGTSANGVQEAYRHTIEDEILTQKFGGGINFTSNEGFLLYLKATVYNFDVLNRKIRTFTKQDDLTGTSSRTSDENVSMKPVTVYALGGGYKF